MFEPKISVIIPVYNTEKYVEETLLSVISQTIFDELEVIVVDDGSSDDSRYIIERYALDYDNIYAYHKENEGQAIARNFGLKIAKGKYIHFLDSDDYLIPTAYEKLYSLAEDNDSDMVIGNVLRFARYNVWQDNIFKQAFGNLNEDIECFNLSDRIQILFDTLSWDKLYKRDFLLENEICFPNKKIYYEDILFSLKAYLLSNSLSYCNDVLYYWRFRNENTSTTQQANNIKNIKDRFEVLRLSHDLFAEFDVDDDIANYEFNKWLNHDLKFFIKRIDDYPPQYHKELFEEIRDIVGLIPDELIENSNSYKKVVYKMIQNNDFDNFMLFAPLEDDLSDNPVVPDFIDEKYKCYFNYDRDIEGEDLIVEISDVSYDEDNICLDLKSHLNYLADDVSYGITFNICDEDNEYVVDKNLVGDNKIFLPLELLKKHNHSTIKASYEFDDFKKTAIIKNRHRKSIEFEDCFIDLDIGVDSYLFIDVRKKADKEIEIFDVLFESDEFIIKGKADNINELYLENVIGFEKNSYQVKYEDDSDIFTCIIPYSDILNHAIKKWELNCSDSLNSIKLSKKCEFFNKCYRIRFLNSRNKILIENDIFNPIDHINQLNDDISNLKSQLASLRHEKYRLKKDNKKLIDKNDRLNRELDEFKSRKAVKIADKLKFH